MKTNYTRKIKYTILAISTLLCSWIPLQAQSDSSGSLLGNIPEPPSKVQNAFKTTKIINLQSLEVTDAGVFDFKINHRFGPVENGVYDIFGLDVATIRIGGEYGVIPNLMVGFGRTNVEKTYDAYFKYRLMHQTSDNKKPLSILIFGDASYRTLKFPYTVTKQQRLAYAAQIIIGRKFSESFSMQLSPSMVHYNIAPTEVPNDMYALGVGFRMKITKRVTFNGEYIPILNSKGDYKNSISAGFDIETGGHVFQLHFTNSVGMNEPQYIARTTGDWLKGGVRFGFNISRVFTVVDPTRFKNNSY